MLVCIAGVGEVFVALSIQEWGMGSTRGQLDGGWDLQKRVISLQSQTVTANSTAMHLSANQARSPSQNVALAKVHKLSLFRKMSTCKVQELSPLQATEAYFSGGATNLILTMAFEFSLSAQMTTHA